MSAHKSDKEEKSAPNATVRRVTPQVLVSEPSKIAITVATDVATYDEDDGEDSSDSESDSEGLDEDFIDKAASTHNPDMFLDSDSTDTESESDKAEAPMDVDKENPVDAAELVELRANIISLIPMDSTDAFKAKVNAMSAFYPYATEQVMRMNAKRNRRKWIAFGNDVSLATEHKLDGSLSPDAIEILVACGFVVHTLWPGGFGDDLYIEPAGTTLDEQRKTMDKEHDDVLDKLLAKAKRHATPDVLAYWADGHKAILAKIEADGFNLVNAKEFELMEAAVHERLVSCAIIADEVPTMTCTIHPVIQFAVDSKCHVCVTIERVHLMIEERGQAKRQKLTDEADKKSSLFVHLKKLTEQQAVIIKGRMDLTEAIDDLTAQREFMIAERERLNEQELEMYDEELAIANNLTVMNEAQQKAAKAEARKQKRQVMTETKSPEVAIVTHVAEVMVSLLNPVSTVVLNEKKRKREADDSSTSSSDS